MNRIQYLLYCLRTMDRGAFLRAVRETADEAHKSQLSILWDMVWCGLRYQAGYTDYQTVEFYLLNKAQRESILTRGKNNAIVKKYNDLSKSDVLEDKCKFFEVYGDFARRDHLDLRTASLEELSEFITQYPAFFAKPFDGVGGHGAARITMEETPDLSALRESLLANGQQLLEEPILQHPALERLYPQAVNSMRLVTFLDDGGEPQLLQAVLKIGNHNSVVDNDGFGGGMFTFLDEQGIARYPGMDMSEESYEYHPMTGVRITDFQVPFFPEAVELVKAAAKITPEIRYVGWDVAIGPDGPLIIEGNSFPGPYEPRGRFLAGKLGYFAEFQKYMDI